MRDELFQKLAARNADISINSMEHGQLTTSMAKKLKNTIENLDDRPFFMSEMSGGTIHNVKKQIRRANREHGVDLAVVDYIQLMDNHIQGEDDFANLRDASRQLNEFTNRAEIPVIGIVSLNQSGQVYGLSQVANDCNNHIALSEVTDQDGGVERDTNERYIAIRKARNGPKGVLKAELKGQVAKLVFENDKPI